MAPPTLVPTSTNADSCCSVVVFWLYVFKVSPMKETPVSVLILAYACSKLSCDKNFKFDRSETNFLSSLRTFSARVEVVARRRTVTREEKVVIVSDLKWGWGLF